jgi:hypothetical protein
LPQLVASALLTLSRAPWFFLLASLGIFTGFAALLEGAPAVIILGPLFYPLAAQMGVSRKAKKLELAYLRRVTRQPYRTFGVSSISLSSDTQQQWPSYKGRYHIRLIHSSASIVDQMRRRSSTTAAIGRLCGTRSSPAL